MQLLETPAEIQSALEENLLRVQKPGRYVGGEFNAVQKPWEAVQTVIQSFRADDDGWEGDETDLEQLQEVGEFIG